MSTKTIAAPAVQPTAPAETIVCAVDFSKYSLGALAAARALASRWGSSLELVCAVDLPAYLNQNQGSRDEREQIGGFRSRILARLRTLAGDDVRCSVWDGPADEAVLEAAKELGSGLIVMGTHGRAGLPRLVLGSTAEAVIAETALPVLVVPMWRDGGWPKRILVPMKYTEYANRALLYAESFARSVKAELGVVHVMEPGAPRRAVEELERHVGRLAGRAAFHARESQYDAAEAILREAETGSYDLIVMAAHRKPFWRDWTFGMTVQRLLRYSVAPVVSVGSGV